MSGNGYSHSVGYEYDNINNLTALVETINGVTRTTSYTYDDDNRVTSINTDGISESYSYDSYGRVTTKVTKNGSTTILTEYYTYKTNSAGQPTNQVATMRSVSSGDWDITHTYEYDANGNITYLGGESGNGTAYIYDSANQLVRENNGTVGLTWIYDYDDAGNMSRSRMCFYSTTDSITKLETENYTYGDSEWGDLLTGWKGETITSDAIGNMLSDGTWTYNWEHGRELASMTDGSSTWSFTYDANGMRTGRSNGSRTYNYVYNGSSLSQLTVDGHTMRFTYDASGSPLSINYDDTEYYYVLNLQGDVRVILDADGNAVVTYYYDGWGNIRWTIDGSLADTLGFYNPLRYRGYVYDAEYKLYYLQSRYYDPEICRFLNADTLVSTGQGLLGNNMFAYCRNNPVIRKDVSGTEDVCVTDFNEDNNPLNDLGSPSGGGGGGRGLGVKSSYYSAQRVQSYDWHWQNSSYNQKPTTSVGTAVCFIAGTLVQYENGTKPIEEIVVGDYVWAWNEETGDIALKEVVETYINETNELVHIFVNGEEIVATPTHPFYSPVEGWIDAVRLRAGDILVLVNGEYVVVEKVQYEILETPITVYNFQVEDYHTYYISSGVLVHNSCMPQNKSPEGAGRSGALNQAKRDMKIPASQQPDAVLPNYDRRGNIAPGRVYQYGYIQIRDDYHGHSFADGGYLPPHFNTPDGGHYFY